MILRSIRLFKIPVGPGPAGDTEDEDMSYFPSRAAAVCRSFACAVLSAFMLAALGGCGPEQPGTGRLDTPSTGSQTQPDTSSDTQAFPATAAESDPYEFERDGVLTFDNYTTTEIYENEAGNEKIYYRFHEPLREHDEPLPLLIFLHGLGDDARTRASMEAGNVGPFIHPLVRLENESADYACYALIPMTPLPLEGWWTSRQLSAFVELMYKIIEDYNIDSRRVYVMGISMGGYTVCDLLNNLPADTFAAAVPMCGASSLLYPEQLHNTGFRIYHAADDEIVSNWVSWGLYYQLKDSGHENVEIFESETGGHLAPLASAFGDDGFFEWLFAQRLPDNAAE